jgi:plastocyanin
VVTGAKSGLVALCAAAILMLAACSMPAFIGATTASATPTPTLMPTETPTAADTATPTLAPITPGVSVATVTMSIHTFTSATTITIKSGQAITFTDPMTSGGTHPLVTGNNGQYTPIAGAPPQFESESGYMFTPGTTVAITFPVAGTFPITCLAHPVMQLTITVTP